MANQDYGNPLGDPATDTGVNQAIINTNYQSYIAQGGNPTTAVVGPEMLVTSGPSNSNNPYDPNNNPYSGGVYSTATYAPYDEGGGHTKWDEFVQQMAYNNAKLAQDAQIEQEREQNAVQLENIRAQEQKYATDQTALDDFGKNLMAEKGPADPYGYLFNSRGLAAPQGYAPTPLPLAQGVADAYKSQGVDLADAQKQISGTSGPSFINGYLGGMPSSQQQGPMGFQNTPGFTNVAPGSQPQPQGGAAQSQPMHAAKGGVVPGKDKGKDTVPAMLRPGEGVLTPETVQSMGGPQAIQQMNAQHFAAGGTVQPLYQQPITNLGNGLFQAGNETANIRQSAAAGGGVTQGWDALNSGVPLRPDAQLGNYSSTVPWGSQVNISGPQVSGANNFSPNNPQGTTGWYQAQLPNGQTGDLAAYDLTNFQMPQVGTKQSISPDLPSGYQMQSPGVATRTAPSAPMAMGQAGAAQQGARLSTQPGWINQVENWFQQGTPATPADVGNFWGGTQPLGSQTQPTGTPPPIGSNPSSSPSAGLLTGGVLQPTAPAAGPPMNLNMLDPYTRSLVDQYGRPQTPSMQAWSQMPQSGQQAYQNYVEKVAGGNMQDLLDQQKQTAPQGDAAGLNNTMNFLS